MRSIPRLLVGYRDDLDLSARWWHRLSKVFFVLSSAVLFISVVFGAQQDGPTNQQTVVIIDNLSDYTNKHPELAETISSFQSLGRVGQLNPTGM